MKNVANKIFGFAAATALAVTPMASANADDVVPANNNAAAAVTATAATVQFVDAQSETINDARILAAAASSDKLAVVVWGGNRAIQQEAYNAARDLVGAGIPTAFVLAPDHNNLDGAAVMQIYALAEPRADGMWGINNVDQIRANIREAGIVAYREAFPQQVATLSLR